MATLLETVEKPWTISDRLRFIEPIHLQEDNSCPTTRHCDPAEQFSRDQASCRRVENNVENSEPIILDLRDRYDDSESHRIRVIHFYMGDDDYEPWKRGGNLSEQSFEEVENEKPKVRRLGEERDGVAIRS